MRIRSAAIVLLALGMVPATALADDGAVRDPGRAAAPQKSPDVPFVPTPEPVVEKMLSMNSVKKGDLVYDLGSGDGRIVINAAKKRGARGVGFDINPERIQEARQNARQAGVTDKVRFVEADLFNVDLSPADVLTLYLLPSVNLRLRPKILSELKPGTRVASHAFDMGEWKPDAQTTVGSATVYHWLVPAKVGGTWKLKLPASAGSSSATLSLSQKFQQVEGTLRVDGRELPIKNAKLEGDKIRFEVAGLGGARSVRFSGRVNGDEITGSLGGARGGGAPTFSAEKQGKAASRTPDR